MDDDLEYARNIAKLVVWMTRNCWSEVPDDDRFAVAWMAAYRAIGTHKPDGGRTLRSWCRLAAHRAVIDEVRRNGGARISATTGERAHRPKLVPLPETDMTATVDPEPSDLFERLKTRLPDREYAVAVALGSGATKAQIARHLGVTPSRVSQHLRTIRAAVKQELAA